MRHTTVLGKAWNLGMRRAPVKSSMGEGLGSVDETYHCVVSPGYGCRVCCPHVIESGQFYPISYSNPTPVNECMQA